jgi:hypothetical protein
MLTPRRRTRRRRMASSSPKRVVTLRRRRRRRMASSRPRRGSASSVEEVVNIGLTVYDVYKSMIPNSAQCKSMSLFYADVYTSGRTSRLWLGSKMGYTLLGASTLSSWRAVLDASWSMVSWTLLKKDAVAVANHLPPPSWKEPR